MKTEKENAGMNILKAKKYSFDDLRDAWINGSKFGREESQKEDRLSESQLPDFNTWLIKREQCQTCLQIDIGQTGEYPCPKCGLPTTWDNPIE